LVQVVNLLELAPGVLIELTLAGQNMELLQEFHALPGADFVDQKMANDRFRCR
jgi:hypothetical protein